MLSVEQLKDILREGALVTNGDAWALAERVHAALADTGPPPASEQDALDARRWRWARDTLLSMSFQSGPHGGGEQNHCPMMEANTSAYWDRVADAAIAATKDRT